MKSRNPSLLSNSAPPRLAEALPNRPNRMSSFSRADHTSCLRDTIVHRNHSKLRGRPMRIAVIHDYADVFRTTRAYQRLTGHDVVVRTDAYTDPGRVVEQVAGCEAVLLTQQRVPVTREIVAGLPDLRFISQTSANVYHIDLAACTEHGVVVSAGRGGGGGGRTPYSTTAELTWGLIIASLRHLPFEVERLKRGHWHSTVGTRLEGQTLGIYAFGHIGAAVAPGGRGFGVRGAAWGRGRATARARRRGRER